jgi:inhibitor of KinA
MNELRIFPLGENAATIDFGGEISIETNTCVLALADYFEQNRFPGFVETVPAYSSLTIFFNACAVRKSFPDFVTAFAAVEFLFKKALPSFNKQNTGKRRTIEIPVCFDEEFALDLNFVAAERGLSPEKTIEIFLAKTYRVFLLGFLPGFAYMGEVDEKIATPRKQTPRVKIPSGSVGIAGRQTGIYSLASPGGWQIVGRTPLKMFDPNNEPPTVLQAGDKVRFVAIDKTSFQEQSAISD